MVTSICFKMKTRVQMSVSATTRGGMPGSNALSRKLLLHLKKKKEIKGRPGGSHLSSQLLWRQRLRGLRFKASLNPQPTSHLNRQARHSDMQEA
jgi:hypothetical protein